MRGYKFPTIAGFKADFKATIEQDWLLPIQTNEWASPKPSTPLSEAFRIWPLIPGDIRDFWLAFRYHL
jgi:hypothetical protein